MFLTFLGWVISWFSKPKKELIVAPKIQPALGDQKQVQYVVLEQFVIHDIIVPKGIKTDGRSGGVVLDGILGAHPFSPAIIAQCIGHDYLYNAAVKVYKGALSEQDKVKKQQAMDMFREADNWFYDALRLNNRKLRCKLFFWAVRAYSTLEFGVWKWYIAPKINKLFNKGEK
jgi:hypothetical protein